MSEESFTVSSPGLDKPPPDRGWEMLNEYADWLPEPEYGEFIANSRDAEFLFTTGMLSKADYEKLLFFSLRQLGAKIESAR